MFIASSLQKLLFAITKKKILMVFSQKELIFYLIKTKNKNIKLLYKIKAFLEVVLKKLALYIELEY